MAQSARPKRGAVVVILEVSVDRTVTVHLDLLGVRGKKNSTVAGQGPALWHDRTPIRQAETGVGA
ncbi:hypothetical protein GCM10010433_58720 [Streptomyces pulveraceus]